MTRDAAAAMAAAEPERRALYADTFTAMLQVMLRREANGSPPDVAAATIARALTAPRPRAVYLCGKDSRRLAILSGLPAPVFDMARRRVFGLPAPAPLPPDPGGTGQQPGRWPVPPPYAQPGLKARRQRRLIGYLPLPLRVPRPAGAGCAGASSARR